MQNHMAISEMYVTIVTAKHLLQYHAPKAIGLLDVNLFAFLHSSLNINAKNPVLITTIILTCTALL